MTDKTDPDFQEAMAADFYQAVTADLESFGPGKLAVARKAISDFEKRAADASNNADYNRKINRMPNAEFNKLMSDIAYDTAPRLVEKK